MIKNLPILLFVWVMESSILTTTILSSSREGDRKRGNKI